MRSKVLVALLTVAAGGCLSSIEDTDSNIDGSDSSRGDGTDPAQLASCPESPAPDLLDAALCVCNDLKDVGALVVGRTIPDDPVLVGINGATTFVNAATIHGDLVSYAGLSAVAALDVDADALSTGDVEFAGLMHVGGDLGVGGDLSGAGFLTVDGALRLGGDDLVIGAKQAGSVAGYVAPAGPPCACGDDEILDVVAEVEAARDDNDNDVAGIGSDIATIGAAHILLASGRYYFENIESIGATLLDIDGNVALYLDGDLESVGAQWIHLRPGATLDLYVAGSVRSIGHVSFGDNSDPSAFRLYIGGEGSPTLSVGYGVFNGSIYAPRATLRYVGATDIRGSVFAEDLTGIGALRIGYAAPSETPDACEPPAAEREPEPDPDREDTDTPPVIL